MKFIVDPQILERFPQLTLGVLVIKGIDNSRTPSIVGQLLRGVCAEVKNRFPQGIPEDDPRVKHWHEAYEKFGVNPKKTLFSAEALTKRVLDGKELSQINAVVDLYNFFSLKHLIPIGGSDLDEICGDIHLTYAQGDEPFWGIGAAELEHPNAGEIVYKDRAGILCRAWNYRDCERAKMTKESRNILLVMEDLGGYGAEKLYQMLHDLSILMTKYCGGIAEETLMGATMPEIELGIPGKTGLSDAEFKPDPRKISAKLLAAKQKAKEEPITGAKSSNIVSTHKKAKEQTSSPEEIVWKHLLKNKLAILVTEAVTRAFPDLDATPVIRIDRPKDESNGDYASNVLMMLTKKLNKSPKELFPKLLENFEKPQYIENISFAEPGFINFSLNPIWLKTKLREILEKKFAYGKTDDHKDQTILVEYSSPNIAKPLGVHHLLSTIIGQTLYNLYQFLGFHTVSINHVGDWGTQFGKLVYAYKTWGDKDIVEANPIDELLKLYVKFHDEVEKTPELEDEGRKEFKKLEQGDTEILALWQWIVDISLKDVQKTYDALGGIHFDKTIGESFYNDKMDAVIQEGEQKKIITVGENGALIVQFDNEKLPIFMVKKSDDTTLYATRDLATVKYRLATWNPRKVIYVVDRAQELHFKQLFETVKMLGWLQETHTELAHVSFGRMNFADGAMSTRKGNIIRLNEVLKESEEKALKIVELKNPELKDKEKQQCAKIIGVGAIKYNILVQNRVTDITFDWDKMLSLEGNSSPYIQYTAARAKSILRKAATASAATGTITEQTKIDLERADAPTHALELDLVKTLTKFEEALVEAATEYKPNTLCLYLYTLAQKYNTFYNELPVLQAENTSQKELRLAITASTLQVLENGLSILGIEIPEKM